MSSHSSQQQDNRLIVGITGHIGAGKTSVGKYLNRTYGFYYIRYSQVLAEWKAQDGANKADLQYVGWEVMAGGMQQELNSRLIAQMPPHGDCAVDGLRHPIDYAALKNTFSTNFRLLYMESTQENRWERLKAKYPKLTDFRDADSRPVEQQIDSLKSEAVAVLENNRSLKDLYSKVDSVLNRIRQGGPK